MDWVSHFLQILLTIFQSVTALIVAVAALITGIATFFGARAKLRSHRDKERRVNYKLPERPVLANPKSNEGNILNTKVSTPLPLPTMLSAPKADNVEPYTNLEQDREQPSETRPRPNRQKDPQLVAVQSALKAASGLTELAHNMAEQCRRSSKSESPYRNQLILLEALAAALPDLQRLARALDSALNKLDIVWDSEDPRRVLFWYVDPFTPFPTQRSAEGMRTTFIEEAERIVAAIENLGYLVEKKKHRWDKRMPLSYVLAQAKEIMPQEEASDKSSLIAD